MRVLTAAIAILAVLSVAQTSAQSGELPLARGIYRAWELGIEVCVTMQFFVRVQGVYRIDRVVGIQGVTDGGRRDLTESVNADGYELSLIIGYIVL